MRGVRLVIVRVKSYDPLVPEEVVPALSDVATNSGGILLDIFNTALTNTTAIHLPDMYWPEATVRQALTAFRESYSAFNHSYRLTVSPETAPATIKVKLSKLKKPGKLFYPRHLPQCTSGVPPQR